ncbi:hypothetical protein DTO166G4_8813 [Paecilomyces variotii]|nr:hypothetical protein DTO166G4_8813 [Paecilomyces variotii]KAJ9222082.1 hypothetical protein DTO169C6_5533 [Paecilomyces variotii]KAJ9236561.1 hypothetical protein DTO166G5_4026 [Paecilomyces variotii]KAJ9255892.1 hypothetical protein DTO207G8_2909 [Paecilomyces variotii]KAJ9306448.1 hypothetical protein DTO217A2_3994 [Paecilomyces variotii]
MRPWRQQTLADFIPASSQGELNLQAGCGPRPFPPPSSTSSPAIINEEFGYPKINISIPFDHLPFPPLRDAFPLVAPFEGANTYLLPLPSPSKTS